MQCRPLAPVVGARAPRCTPIHAWRRMTYVGAGACACAIPSATIETLRLPSTSVSRRYPLAPLGNCLFTPELQWQSRGKWRILQGCELETPGPGGHKDVLRDGEKPQYDLRLPMPSRICERASTRATLHPHAHLPEGHSTLFSSQFSSQRQFSAL
jgi:hypothetical protein